MFDALPLTSSQADIWLAQQFMPDVSFAIAYYVDIVGTVNVDTLAASGSTAHREFSSSTMRIAEVDGIPMQRFVDADTEAVEILDFREHERPEEAARQWMNDDCRTPFSMDGQLVRLRVLRVGDDRVFWYTRAHHIALDGYASMKVLERAATLYSAMLGGVEPEPIDATSPAELLAEDERYRTSTRARRDRAHWASADLGCGAPWGRSAQPASVPIVVGEDRSISRTASGRATSTVVIAAFAAYLARMNDADDVDLSLPVSARPTALLRRAGSSLSHVVPLRLPGVGSATVNNVVKSAEVAIGAVLRHQRTRPPVSESGHAVRAGRFGPTINVMMFANTVAVGDFDGEIDILTTGPVSDLAVNIYPGRGGERPRIDFEANSNVYTPSDLARRHERFLHFLDRFVDSGCGDTAVADLDLFLPEEPRATPASVGAASTEPGSLNDVLSTVITQHGSRIAIQDGEVSVTYAELDTRVAALASALTARGIGTEDRVAVRIGRSVEGVVAFWAIARVGAVYVPVDPSHPRERAEFVMRDSGAVVGLCSGGGQFGEVEWLDLDEVLAEGGPGDESTPTAPHRAAYVIYTSGSTGTPKGVVVTHDGIAALVQQIRSSYDLDVESRVCHLASPGFDTAIVEVLAAATAGAAVVIAPPDSYGGAELSELIARQKITHMLITPSALATLDPAALAGVGTIVIGGEAAPQDTVDRWSVDRRLVNAYGPTETTCSVTMTAPLNPGSADGIGRAMVGAVIHLLDRTLRPVPSGAGRRDLHRDPRRRARISRSHAGYSGALRREPVQQCRTADVPQRRSGASARRRDAGIPRPLRRSDQDSRKSRRTGGDRRRATIASRGCCSVIGSATQPYRGRPYRRLRRGRPQRTGARHRTHSSGSRGAIACPHGAGDHLDPRRDSADAQSQGRSRRTPCPQPDRSVDRYSDRAVRCHRGNGGGSVRTDPRPRRYRLRGIVLRSRR